MTTIAVDAMGGDNAPAAVVQGALSAARDPALRILLVGRRDELRPLLPTVPANLRFVDAPDAVAMDEPASATIRSKPRSSIMVGLECVRRGEADAFVSFGNTGAVVAASLRQLGRIAGVDRPALGTVFRNARGARTLLLDVGVNVDCRPEYYVQFATMGRAYFQRVLHHGNPSVGLLNVGEERAKGNQRAQRAHELLSELETHFIGNVEGKELVGGAADIVVTDGFTGNVAIKVAEAIAAMLAGEIRESLMSRPHYKLGAWVARGAFDGLKARLNYQRIGGAPLFGVDGAVLIGHGRADAEAVASGIRTARTLAESGLVEAIRAAFGEARSLPAHRSRLRPTPAAERGEPPLEPGLEQQELKRTS